MEFIVYVLYTEYVYVFGHITCLVHGHIRRTAERISALQFVGLFYFGPYLSTKIFTLHKVQVKLHTAFQKILRSRIFIWSNFG